MSHPLQTELVVTDLREAIVIAYRLEVIKLIETANRRQVFNSLFRNDVIQLEFSELDVQPGALQQVVEAYPCGFKVEGGSRIRRRCQQERNVLEKCAAGQYVEAR